MLDSRLAVAGCVAAALLSLTGCGSDDTTTSGVVDETGRVPPDPPPEKPGDGSDMVLAVDKVFLGETNRDGSPNKNGWKLYGFNLDKKISTTSSSDLCKPAADATPSAIYPDGEEGIDNSFGKNILPIIVDGIEPAPSASVDQGIADGAFTIMLDIEKLGGGESYNPLTTRLYAGADLGKTPNWDGNDMWPVRPELLDVPTDITSSKVVFDNSYVTDNTWVSGGKADVKLDLTVSGYAISLTISSALISMDLDADDHASAVNGTIAGVLETEVLIEELKKVIGGIQPSLCEGAAIDSIINQIRQASDIMKDGTQDPTQTCNGISVGLGFTAKAVKLGEIAPASEPQSNPCPESLSGG